MTPSTHTLTPDRFDIFSLWAAEKMSAYANELPKYYIDNPHSPPRRGIAPGQQYSFSMNKYTAAVWSVLHGTRLKDIGLTDLLKSILFIQGPNKAPSLGTFQVWRTQKRFKGLVKQLRHEYADYMASNILDGGLVDAPGLRRQISYIYECLQYPPNLIRQISAGIASRFDYENSRLTLAGYLGYYIFCIILLTAIRNAVKIRGKRAVYLEIGKTILGQDYNNSVLSEYLRVMRIFAPPWELLLSGREDDSKTQREWKESWIETGLREHDFKLLQQGYVDQLRLIVNWEIRNLEDRKNLEDKKNLRITAADITAVVDFLSERWTEWRL
jgi:hypothetical protein